MGILTAIIAGLKAIPALAKIAALLEDVFRQVDRNRVDRRIDDTIDRMCDPAQQRDAKADEAARLSGSGEGGAGMVPGCAQDGKPPGA